MPDLITLQPVLRETGFTNTLPAYEAIPVENGIITSEFVELLTELIVEPDKNSVDIGMNAIKKDSNAPTRLELPGSELEIEGELDEALIPLATIPLLTEEESLEQDDIEQNNALAWINFPDFQPPQPLNLKIADNEPVLESSGNNSVMDTKGESRETFRGPVTDMDPAIPEKALAKGNEAWLPLMKSEDADSEDKEFSLAGREIESPVDERAKEVFTANILQENDAVIPSPMMPPGKTDAAIAPGSEKQVLTLPLETEAPEWGEHFNQQILWLGKQNLKSALIKLQPEALGPIEININMAKNSTSMNIVSHNPQIRELITQALPDLYTMMAEQGLNLTEVHVDSESRSWQDHQQSSPEEHEGSTDQHHETASVTLIPERVKRGLVDYFA